jgi:SlyX protein
MEDYVNSLQSVVLEHTKTIDLLRTENKLLAQKVKDMSELMEGDVPNRKPPHY